jgi:hypothetical protein
MRRSGVSTAAAHPLERGAALVTEGHATSDRDRAELGVPQHAHGAREGLVVDAEAGQRTEIQVNLYAGQALLHLLRRWIARRTRASAVAGAHG